MKQVEVVGAVIVNEQQEILCALRSQAMSQGGMWEFPGGKVEPGENHAQTLIREIHEELGCEITVLDFVTDCLFEYPRVRVHLHTYYARIVSGEPSPNEHERLEWVSPKKLNSLSFAPADIPTVNQLLRDFPTTKS